MSSRYEAITSKDDTPSVHELRTVKELRAASHPLRATVLRLMKEEERSVKDLCELLGETTTRLYYHVRQLEDAGLIRLVRTEKRARSVLKYYRATAMVFTIPFDMLQEHPESPEAMAGVSMEAKLMELGAADVRYALSSGVGNITVDEYSIARFLVRTTPERVREFTRQLEELLVSFANSDQEDGTVRYSMTSALVPVDYARRSGHARASREAGNPDA